MKTYICKRCVPHTCILQTHVHPVVCQSFPLKTKIKAEWVLKEPPNQEVTVDAVLLTCETCPLEYDPTCENYLCD